MYYVASGYMVDVLECGELLYGRRFPLKLKGVVCKSYVRPAILYGSEAFFLRGSEMGILRRTERSIFESNAWSTAER